MSLDEMVGAMFGRPANAVDQQVTGGTCKACGQKVQGVVRLTVDPAALNIAADGKVTGSATMVGAIYHHECNGPVATNP